ncbi:MAG: sporulation protein YqfD [Ruminococcus sp.]|nr:sporulation protein YqfD [Ruminococcus sp.]
MKHYIKIRINTKKKTDALIKLNKIKADIKNIIYLNDGISVEILNTDLKKVRKYLSSFKVEIIDETGFYKIKREFKRNSLFIISIILGIILFLILSNVIVKVQVIHENKEIRDLLYNALDERGVKPLTFKKSYEKYEAIIEDIKNTYKDKLEWLEIDVDGMVINIRVEERIIKSYDKEYQNCHIVATKSGVVNSIRVEKGVQEISPNTFVNKGDILISGMIKYNDEIKNNVCASGEVYAEVWYHVTTSLPLNYEEENLTGKWRFNFILKTNNDEYTILKSRVNDKKIKKILLFKIFGLEFYITKEYEVSRINKRYTEEEALKKAQELTYEKLKMNANFSKIITEKVLKKSINNDNLDIDIFIAINEQIGKKEFYVIDMESDTNDEGNN